MYLHSFFTSANIPWERDPGTYLIGVWIGLSAESGLKPKIVQPIAVRKAEDRMWSVYVCDLRVILSAFNLFFPCGMKINFFLMIW